MEKPWKIAVMGECMVELHREGQHLVQTYGGDTFNTAAYLARICGEDVKVNYMSAVGAGDSFSEGMIKFWRDNGVESSLTQKLPGKLPGLYAIEVDENGERSFLYWRNEAAVKDCFKTPQADELLAKLREYDLIYLSGISLAVLNPESREKFLKALEELSAQGIKIAFDFNYRPHLWEKEDSAPHYRRVCAICDWIFLSPEELIAVGEEASDLDSPSFVEQMRKLGGKEVIVKNGSKPCLLIKSQGDVIKVDVAEKLSPKDSTAAGDSFTAGYLGASLYGLAHEERIRRAQKLAGAVIMEPGAIIPAQATPHIFKDLQKEESK